MSMRQPVGPGPRIHNPNKLWLEEQKQKETVTRDEFDKRLNVPSRMEGLEKELDQHRGMLKELSVRFGELEKTVRSMRDQAGLAKAVRAEGS